MAEGGAGVRAAACVAVTVFFVAVFVAVFFAVVAVDFFATALAVDLFAVVFPDPARRAAAACSAGACPAVTFWAAVRAPVALRAAAG